MSASSGQASSTTRPDFRSRSLERFGINPQAQAPTPTPVEVEEKPEVPSLGKFAEAWLEERRATLMRATAYDYDRLIKKALLLPVPFAQKRIDEIHDGEINRFLGELMKRKGLTKRSDRAEST